MKFVLFFVFMSTVLTIACWTPQVVEHTRTITVRVPQPCAWLWVPPAPERCDVKTWGEQCTDIDDEARVDWDHTTADYYRNFVVTQCAPPSEENK